MGGFIRIEALSDFVDSPLPHGLAVPKLPENVQFEHDAESVDGKQQVQGVQCDIDGFGESAEELHFREHSNVLSIEFIHLLQPWQVCEEIVEEEEERQNALNEEPGAVAKANAEHDAKAGELVLGMARKNLNQCGRGDVVN